MYFEILGKITNVETFAVGSSIREIARLRKLNEKGIVRANAGDSGPFPVVAVATRHNNTSVNQ